MEPKSLGQELLLHEYRLLKFDQIHLHELQFGNLAVEISVGLVVHRTPGRGVELGGLDDRLGEVDVGDPYRTRLVKLSGKADRFYVFPIDHVDGELHHLFLLLIIRVNAGEFPGGDEKIALFCGNRPGTNAVGVLGKRLAIEGDICVATWCVGLKNMEPERLYRCFSIV